MNNRSDLDIGSLIWIIIKNNGFCEKFADAKRICPSLCVCACARVCVCVSKSESVRESLALSLHWIMDPMIDFRSHRMKNVRHKSYNFWPSKSPAQMCTFVTFICCFLWHVSIRWMERKKLITLFNLFFLLHNKSSIWFDNAFDFMGGVLYENE